MTSELQGKIASNQDRTVPWLPWPVQGMQQGALMPTRTLLPTAARDSYFSHGMEAFLPLSWQDKQDKLPEQGELECSEKCIYNATFPRSEFLDQICRKIIKQRQIQPCMKSVFFYATGIRSSVAGTQGYYNHMRRLTYFCKSQQPFIQTE